MEEKDEQLSSIFNNQRNVLAELGAATNLDELGDLSTGGGKELQRFLELDPKFKKLELRGQELEDYFATQNALEMIFGGAALDGGYVRIANAYKEAQGRIIKSLKPAVK